MQIGVSSKVVKGIQMDVEKIWNLWEEKFRVNQHVDLGGDYGRSSIWCVANLIVPTFWISQESLRRFIHFSRSPDGQLFVDEKNLDFKLRFVGISCSAMPM